MVKSLPRMARTSSSLWRLLVAKTNFFSAMIFMQRFVLIQSKAVSSFHCRAGTPPCRLLPGSGPLLPAPGDTAAPGRELVTHAGRLQKDRKSDVEGKRVSVS